MTKCSADTRANDFLTHALRPRKRTDGPPVGFPDEMLFDAVTSKRFAGARTRKLTVLRPLGSNITKRLSWGVVDQAVSSVTNAAVSIFIARTLGAVQFGAFSLAYVTFSFALNASRGLATDPLMVRFSGVSTSRWRGAVRGATGTAVIVGLATGIWLLC